MNAFLSLTSQVVAFGDVSPNSNPTLKFVDWSRSQSQIPVNNPGSQSLVLSAYETKCIFSSARTTTIDDTTQFDVTASPLDVARYRFTYSTGNAPGLRTDRGISTMGITLSLAANNNGTLTLTAGSGSPFSAVVVSDILFIPGVSTGDTAAGFDILNEGEWIVLGTSDTVLTLVRSGDFSGVTEIVVPATDVVQAYSASGVQVGDNVDISAGFVISTQRTYEVVSVTARWFEIVSPSPMAIEAATPGVTGIAFYAVCKKYVKVESDQECTVRVNGDTGSCNRIFPLQVGNVGHFEKSGPSWSLTLVNRSPVSANVTVISAE